MKKLAIALLIIIAVFAGCIFLVVTNLDTIAKVAIEHYGSEVTQTAVQVDKVRIQIKKGKTRISGLRVSNPAAFSDSSAFALGNIRVAVDTDTILENLIVVKEILIERPKVFFEINSDNSSNLGVISDNLTKDSGSTAEGEQSGESGSGRMIRVNKVVIEEAGLDAKIVPMNNREYSLTLPKLTLKNLGGENGATAGEISKQIVKQLIEHARRELKKQGIEAKYRNKLDNRKKELKAEARDKLDEEKESLKDRLKSIAR